MRHILFMLGLLPFLFLAANAQPATTQTAFVGTCQFSGFSASGPNVVGTLANFSDQTNLYFASDIQVGDVAWDNLGTRWEIIAVTSSNLVQAVVTMRNINGTGGLPFGVGFVSRETPNIGLSMFPPDNSIGISPQLKSRVEGHNAILLDSFARSFQIRNIIDEGAVGDGSTDNYAAIQTALNTYNFIYIPPGNFKTSQTLVVPPGGTIFGSGYTSIISMSVGDTIIRLNVNCTLDNLKIDGTDAPGQIGVYWRGLATVNVKVRNCEITDVVDGVKVDSTGYGPYLSSYIQGNSIRSCGTGINLGNRAEYIQLLGNICEQNTTGMYIRGGNNSVVGGSTNSNSVGISIDGGSNNAHTSVTGLSSNHNSTKAIEIDSVSLGLLITGCNFFASPRITINASNSVQFINNNIDCTVDHVVTASTEMLYTNNIWWNNTSDPTLDATSKASLIGNRVKGSQAVTSISAPNTTGIFPLNLEMPSTSNRGFNITREGVSSSDGFMGLWSQTSLPGIFSPFWYAKGNSSSYPHLAFIALNNAGSDTGTSPSIVFQAGDGYTNVNRPFFSFDAQTSDVLMRINVGKNITMGWGSIRQDSVRLAVRGFSTSESSYVARFYNSNNTPIFSVANSGVTTIPATIWRNSSKNVGEFIGTGSPEGVLTANPGSTFLNSDGINPALYIKTTGTGNTNWMGVSDFSPTNEGVIGVSAGASNTSVITSNTPGSTGVTVTAGTGLGITETTSSNGGDITLSVSAYQSDTISLAGSWVNASADLTVYKQLNRVTIQGVLNGETIPASGTINITTALGTDYRLTMGGFSAVASDNGVLKPVFVQMITGTISVASGTGAAIDLSDDPSDALIIQNTYYKN